MRAKCKKARATRSRYASTRTTTKTHTTDIEAIPATFLSKARVKSLIAVVLPIFGTVLQILRKIVIMIASCSKLCSAESNQALTSSISILSF